MIKFHSVHCLNSVIKSTFIAISIYWAIPVVAEKYAYDKQYE